MFPALSLAKAEYVDSTNSNFITVLACAGIVLLAGVVAMIPILIAWSRRHKQSEAIFAVAMLWGLLASISAGSTVLAQMKYSHEHLLQIESGYYDPQDTSDAPAYPWASWAGLTIGYCILIAWPLMGKRAIAPPNPLNGQ